MLCCHADIYKISAQQQALYVRRKPYGKFFRRHSYCKFLMKTVFHLACTLTLLLSCSDKKNKQSEVLELEEVAKFALNKPVRLVRDSLRLSADKLTFVDESPGVLSSVVVDYNNKGTVEFFFPRTSIISENLDSKGEYLKKVGDKIINKVEWKNVNGQKGSIKNLTIY